MQRSKTYQYSSRHMLLWNGGLECPNKAGVDGRDEWFYCHLENFRKTNKVFCGASLDD